MFSTTFLLSCAGAAFCAHTQFTDGWELGIYLNSLGKVWGIVCTGYILPCLLALLGLATNKPLLLNLWLLWTIGAKPHNLKITAGDILLFFSAYLPTVEMLLLVWLLHQV